MTKKEYEEQIDMMFQAGYCAICNCHEHVGAFPCDCEDTEAVQKGIDLLIEIRKEALANYDRLHQAPRKDLGEIGM